MITVERVPNDTEGFAREMLEAITAACRLPAGAIRDGLIVEITRFMKIVSKPLVVAVESPSTPAAGDQSTSPPSPPSPEPNLHEPQR